MRIGEKCIVVDETNQGRIKIFADDCLKLAEIQTYIFKRLKTFGCVDLFGILFVIGIDEVKREDLHWWITDCSIDDLLDEWIIYENDIPDIQYKYAAIVTNFKYMEL